MSSEDRVVRFHGVEQRQEHFHLGPLQLDIVKGYVTAIVGPNGSGKSTLFKHMLGMIRPDAGKIEVFGEQLDEQNNVAIKQRIGYLPESPFAHESSIRGSEKTAFLQVWYPKWNVNYYSELLRMFEIDPNIKLGKMSKGMRRKFDLVIALSHQPELLILDEPSSGLDPIAWKKMIDLLHRYMESGERTILMATHIPDEVKRLADYIVFVAYGRVLGYYEKDELFSKWQCLYIQLPDQERTMTRLAAMPGVENREVSGSLIRVVTSEFQKAEQWLAAEGIAIASCNAMELDDILETMINKDRLRMR
ncbi:ABC transporter ATP-binding protein [Paenibacillaceae bacterium]|nr:ABC transporter ATP-binding protein [Paenibacillaceae bacterium]